MHSMPDEQAEQRCGTRKELSVSMGANWDFILEVIGEGLYWWRSS